MLLLLLHILVNSGVYHTCGGGHGRQKRNVAKGNLDGHVNGGLHIHQNWIWKKLMKLRMTMIETLLPYYLKTKLKDNNAF